MPYQQNYYPTNWRSNNPDDYYTASDDWSKAKSFFEDLGLGFLTSPIGDAIDKKVNPGKLPDYQSGMGMNNLHKQRVYGVNQPLEEMPQQPEYDATGSVIEAIGLGSMLFGGMGGAAAKGAGAAAKAAEAASKTAKTALPSLTESLSSFRKPISNISKTPQGIGQSFQRSNSLDLSNISKNAQGSNNGLGSLSGNNNSFFDNDFDNIQDIVNGHVDPFPLKRSNTQNYSNNPLIDNNIGNNRNINNRNGYNQLPEELDKADSSSYHTAKSYVDQNSDSHHNANETSNSYVSNDKEGWDTDQDNRYDRYNNNQPSINNSFINSSQTPNIGSSNIGGTGGGFGFSGNNRNSTFSDLNQTSKVQNPNTVGTFGFGANEVKPTLKSLSTDDEDNNLKNLLEGNFAYNDNIVDHNDLNFSIDDNQNSYSNTGLGNINTENAGNAGNTKKIGPFSGLAIGGYVEDKNYNNYIDPDSFYRRLGLGSYNDYAPLITPMYNEYNSLSQEINNPQTFGLGGIATNFGTSKRNRG